MGDRHETCLLAYHLIYNGFIIAHIHGGEITDGSRDEMWRHAVTKMAQIHLTSHDDFSKRIIRMGENPVNVFNVGSLGVYRAKKLFDRIKKRRRFLKDNDVSFEIVPRFTVILHPNTIDPDKTEQECIALLGALELFDDFMIDFYAPNMDQGRWIIERKFKAFCELNSSAKYIEEKSGDDFLNSLASSKCIIGNSSCGIIEAPTLGVPAVNLGERQNGRPRAKSVINTSFNQANIERAIKMALENKFDFTNPYDNVKHDTVDMICDIILNHPVEFKKRFMD